MARVQRWPELEERLARSDRTEPVTKCSANATRVSLSLSLVNPPARSYPNLAPTLAPTTPIQAACFHIHLSPWYTSTHRLEKLQGSFTSSFPDSSKAPNVQERSQTLPPQRRRKWPGLKTWLTSTRPVYYDLSQATLLPSRR